MVVPTEFSFSACLKTRQTAGTDLMHFRMMTFHADSLAKVRRAGKGRCGQTVLHSLIA